MVRTGKGKKMQAMVLLLAVIFGLGLSCLALPQEAAGEATTAWVQRFNGPANGYDSARAMALDSQGNVIVTGESTTTDNRTVCATVKYSPDGQCLWTSFHTEPGSWPNALAVDAQDNVYIAGEVYREKQGSNSLIVKYSLEGRKLWVRHYNGPGRIYSSDSASAIAIDGQGNVLVTGTSEGTAKTGDDYLTIKYSPEGRKLWARRYDWPEKRGNDDYATGIAVDGQGNVYVTGFSEGKETGSDFATVKYSPDGRTLWVRRYNGPTDGSDMPNSIALDGQGNVYVTGTSYGGLSGSDYLTIKYSPDGRRLWVRRYNGSAVGYEYTTAMVADSQGNVYVTGYSMGDFGMDFATVKYDSDGEQLWAGYYNNWGTYPDYASALAVDGQGNVYVTGSSYGRQDKNDRDIATVKYRPDGQQLWVCRYYGPASYDYPLAVALDGQGNVYVTGTSESGENDWDYVTIKYSQTP